MDETKIDKNSFDIITTLSYFLYTIVNTSAAEIFKSMFILCCLIA